MPNRLSPLPPWPSPGDTEQQPAWLSGIYKVGLWLLVPLAIFYLAEAVVYFRGLDGFFDSDGRFLGRDFATWWTAARLTLDGNVKALFDFDLFHQAQMDLFGQVFEFKNWGYPPYAILWILWLGPLSYPAALAAWTLAGFALYAFTVAYQRSRPWMLTLILALAPSSCINIVEGQMGFLTAACLVGGLRLLDESPILAGIVFGCLSFKPHLGLFVPVALLAARAWKTIVVAIVTVAILTGITVYFFGMETWVAYADITMPFQRYNLEAPMGEGGIFQFMMISPFMAMRLLGGSLVVSYAATMLALIVAGEAVLSVFKNSKSPELRAAVTITAAFFASPYMFTYDTPALSAAVVAMIMAAMNLDGSTRGARLQPFHLTLFLIAWMLPLYAINLNTAGLPIYPLVTAGLLFLQVQWAKPRNKVSKDRSCNQGAVSHGGKSIAFEKPLFLGALVLYACAWAVHLYMSTAALRGLMSDGGLVFLIHLSESYVFNTLGNMVHLFSVGLPRDAQLLLNALGLQGALWLGIRNPMVLKYIFVFWQFALPGFLYLILFGFLWKNKKLHWAIFPLISWAILSVPVDMIAINSTRWAIPIFWMHFFLMLFAEPKVRLWPLAGVLLIGAAMWGGLYEIVVLYCVLCVGLGVLLWAREKNKIPLVYALLSVPGAYRAMLSFIAVGHATPNNNFSGFGLFPNVFALFLPFLSDAISGGFQNFPDALAGYYFYLLLIGIPLLYIAAIATAPKIWLPYFHAVLAAVAVFAIGTIAGPFKPFSMFFALRFDYVFLSLGLMAWAGMLRVWKLSPSSFAMPAATIALLAGAMLWAGQSKETFGWQACRADYEAHKGDQPLIVGSQLYNLIQHNGNIGYGNEKFSKGCQWPEYTAWTDFLISPDIQVRQLSLPSFWQDFSFVKKDNEIYLHTNNWTLVAPPVLAEEADLPIKTLLYDLTPLYEKVGLGPLVTRVHCQSPEINDDFWRPYLMSLSDDKRALMHVCPR